MEKYLTQYHFQVYIGEISDPKIRGRLASLATVFLSLGILFSYSVGAYLHWRTSCYVLTIPSIVLFCFLYCAPETPYWYILKNQDEKALTTLSNLWRKDPTSNKSEIKVMKEKVENVGTNISYSELLKRRSLIPLLIALFVQFCQQISGGNILNMYTNEIFDHLINKNSLISVEIATILVGVLQVAGTLLSLVLIDKTGRKTLLSVSMITFGCSFLFLSVFYYYVHENGYTWPIELGVGLDLLASLCFCFGLRSVPWILSSELFNTKIRSRANSVSQLFNRLCNLIIVQVNC